MWNTRGGRSRFAIPNSRRQVPLEGASQPRAASPTRGELLREIGETDLRRSDEMQSSFKGPAEITDCVNVASYNWRDGNDPTILIPGTSMHHIAYCFGAMVRV